MSLSFNLESMIIFIRKFIIKQNVPSEDIYVVFISLLLFFFLCFNSEKKFRALKIKYKNEKNKIKKGYAVLAYMIISILLPIVLKFFA